MSQSGASGGARPRDPAPPIAAARFDRPALEVARNLIGATLVVRGAGGVIVETEAYGPDDPASHSFRGVRRANAAMFGPPGRAYVYRSHGVHLCLNVVCARGHAVLLRAIAPTLGVAHMQARRGARWALRDLCSGPGRLGQALGIGPGDDGAPFDRPGFGLFAAPAPVAVVAGPRIGISRATERPWRFGLAGSRFVSRRFPGPLPD
ncbi:MAG: DNA-3-methyladenine glycosylase [Rhodobacteraceae bacterium]|nr:DNA-3-methyladenine glycosylase [Paracoccaceae bacterium]